MSRTRGRPKKSEAERRIPVTFMCPPDLLEELNATVEKEHHQVFRKEGKVSRSNFVEQAVRYYLKQK